MAKNVERDRSSKDPNLWDNFCLPIGMSGSQSNQEDAQINIRPVINHGINSNIRVLSDDEIKYVIDTAVNEAFKRNQTVLTPLFGPVRKLGKRFSSQLKCFSINVYNCIQDIEKLRIQENKSKLNEDSSDESSSLSISSKIRIKSKKSENNEESVHIVEEFDLKNDHQQSKKSSREKIEVQNVMGGNEMKYDESIQCSEGSSQQSNHYLEGICESMDCENENDEISAKDAALTFREEQHLKNIMMKV